MIGITIFLHIIVIYLGLPVQAAETPCNNLEYQATSSEAYTDAGEFGFSPDASGVENAKALQQAIDQGERSSSQNRGYIKLLLPSISEVIPA